MEIKKIFKAEKRFRASLRERRRKGSGDPAGTNERIQITQPHCLALHSTHSIGNWLEMTGELR